MPMLSIIPISSTPQAVSMPLMQSAVRAGFPSPAENEIEGPLDLNEFMIQHREATFFCRIQGRSMEGERIFDGDVVIVDRSLTAHNGCIVIATVNGAFTVKRFVQRGAYIALEGAAPDYPTIVLQEGQELQVWGVVTGSVRRFV